MTDLVRVAFLGKMGTAKTTAAKFFVDYKDCTRVSLAGKLKEIAEIRHLPEEKWAGELFGHAFELLPDPIYSMSTVDYRHPRTGRPQLAVPIHMLVQLWTEDLRESEDMREMYQRIGTDSGRFIKPEIWIDHFARNLSVGDAVVDDLRFVNEGEAMTRLGFLKVKLTMPEEQRQARLKERDGFFKEERQGHASETELDEIVPDVIIHNVGTREDLTDMLSAVWVGFRRDEIFYPGMGLDQPVELHPDASYRDLKRMVTT